MEDSVSKLGSKEVTKTCHLERSERSQTHPNLVLKREGTCNYTLASRGRGIKLHNILLTY